MDDWDDEIGIPNVPAIVWYEQLKRWRERLDKGLCPDCGTPVIDTGMEEICPKCDIER